MIRSSFKTLFNKTPDQAQTLIDLIPGVLFQFVKTHHGEMKFEFVSSKIQELTGLSTNEFLRLKDPIQSSTHPNDLESLMSQIAASESYLRPIEWQGRIQIKNKTKWIHVKGNPIKNQFGDLTWAGIIIDITLQRFLSDQFLEYKSRQISDDKIRSLNQMASGIAHEINTPLTTAKMNVEIIQSRLLKNGISDDTFTKCIQRFEHATEKISKVIDRLRQLSRDNSKEETKVYSDLNSIVQRCVDHVAELYDQQFSVRIDFQTHPEPLPVMVDEQKIFQAIIHLISNSKDAVTELSDKRIEISTYSTPVYNYLKIKDNGVGIPKALLNKVFEPFYTTKIQNMNSGVGLSISGSILSQHNAIIDISSVHIDENPSHHGTEITIKFPIARQSEYDSTDLKTA